MPDTLRTPRLRLGPWSADDLAPLEALVRERLVSAPHIEQPDRAEVARRLARRRTELVDTGISLLAIRVGAEFAGYCGLIIGRSTLDEPEIAYELAARFHGHGYATEAARAIVDAAAQTGRHRLWATVRSWNAASFNVLDKIGFTRADRIETDEHGEVVWCARDL